MKSVETAPWQQGVVRCWTLDHFVVGQLKLFCVRCGCFDNFRQLFDHFDSGYFDMNESLGATVRRSSSGDRCSVLYLGLHRHVDRT